MFAWRSSSDGWKFLIFLIAALVSGSRWLLVWVLMAGLLVFIKTRRSTRDQLKVDEASDRDMESKP